jgi:hypothetical protein
MPNNHLSALRFLYCICLLLFCAGCAASSATMIEEEVVTNPRPMYNYTSLVIQDLELNRELYADVPDSEMGRRALRYAQLPGELSSHIERYVTALGIYKSVSREGNPDVSTLVLTGKFIRLGRFKITVVINLRDGMTGQDVATFRQTLWDVMDTTESFGDLGREVVGFMYRIQYK